MTAKEQYHAYLKTDGWRAISNEIKSRAKYRCQICNSRGPLNTHHRTYENLYRERDHMEDLVCLCEVCHERHHFPPEPKVITKTVVKTEIKYVSPAPKPRMSRQQLMEKLSLVSGMRVMWFRLLSEEEINGYLDEFERAGIQRTWRKRLKREIRDRSGINVRLFRDGLIKKKDVYDGPDVSHKMPPGDEPLITMTRELVLACMTANGGFTMATIKSFGFENAKRKWARLLVGKQVTRFAYRMALEGAHRKNFGDIAKVILRPDQQIPATTSFPPT